MTENRRPAVALTAVPGRRLATLETAKEIEKRGFSGIYCASFGDGIAQCEALLTATENIPIGTAIANLYTRHPSDFAITASRLHEVSGGRFRFGIGVSHAPVNRHLGVQTGKPLADMRKFVEDLRAVPRMGELAPVVIAAMRQKMVALAGEIGQGVVFANASRSHMPKSLSHLPAPQQNNPDFFIGDMIPICISNDRQAAMERNRKTLTMYVSLPNYRNYWKEAGYEEEMSAIEAALEKRDRDALPGLMTERWLADVSLFGSASEVREGVEAWYDTGVNTPILVPSSAVGNQMVALQELFAAFE